MNPRNLRRKIYDRKQLNKQAQKNRQITGPIRKKKKQISQEIIQEIEKEDNDIIMADEESKEKAGEDEKSSKTENDENSKEEKEPKKKIERLKLDEKTLLYNRDTGLRKYYEVITNTQFKEKDVTKNLDKLINITRNWHFMLYPKYDFDYFTKRLIALGKQPPTKSFMSRVRRIYKGELKWDVIYDEQEQILGKASIMKDEKKEFENPEQENKKENVNENINELEKNKIKNKNDEFDYNDEEQGIIRDLFLKDEIVDDNKEKIEEEEKNNNDNNDNRKEKEEFDIKDSDFDNFDQDYNPEEEITKKENKENKDKIIFNGVEIDPNEKPDISGINSLKEKRTSMQIEENENNNNENNDEMKPQSLNNKIILDK